MAKKKLKVAKQPNEEKVTLYHPISAPQGRAFDPQHAANIMASEHKGGWSDQPPILEESQNTNNGTDGTAD